MLVLLYYLSQNPDFHESVKPLMGQLKNSEQMLSFLNDLSKFTQTFSALKNMSTGGEEKPKEKEQNPSPPPPPKKEKEPENKKEPQSPTEGIADAFIQQILEGYLQKH